MAKNVNVTIKKFIKEIDLEYILAPAGRFSQLLSVPSIPNYLGETRILKLRNCNKQFI